MALDSNNSLTLLLARLKDWLPISEFKVAMNEYFSVALSSAEKADYLAKKSDLKKLRDEVAPVLHYVKFATLEGESRFELGNGVPDCRIRDDASTIAHGIKVTVAQSRE